MKLKDTGLMALMATLALLSVLMMLLSSCGWSRRQVVQVGEHSKENVAAMTELSTMTMETWPFVSGMIRKGLGTRINELPADTVAAMNELDILCGVHIGEDGRVIVVPLEDISSFEYGANIGLRIRMTWAVIEKVLEEVAPDVLGSVIKFL